jgi:hypothetical protein
MQRHPELEEQYAVVHSINGDGRTRSRQDRQPVDGNSTAAEAVDVAGAVLERNLQDEVTAAVTMITDHRADIEQAKGMLMLIHGIADPQAAFELLRWRSQETNTKLRVLARQVISDFVGVSGRETLPTQTTYDNLFLTAHLRVESDAASEKDTG